ncbi:MAG TPA: acetate--CoA ligase family protein [Geobacterales bacterium]|nr:acetate--CoA ligase family protein [Geobacterales bacterium]
MKRDFFLELIKKANQEGREFLFEYESKALLKAYEIPTTNFFFIKNESELGAVIKEIRYPCVAKIVSRQAIHKSDIGGVILGIRNENELISSLEKISKIAESKAIKLEGYLIEEQAKQGIEIIVGMIKDRVFGNVLMFGLGGIYTEAFKDVNFLILPASKKDYMNLIMNTKIGKIISNSRGKTIAVDAILQILTKVSELIEENPEVIEMDLNPIVVNEDSAKVLDARIRFRT